MSVTLLESTYRQYSQPMLAYLLRLTEDLDQAQEIWHETFLLALQQWPQKPPENPPAWLKITAKNKFIDKYRHHQMTREKVQQLVSEQQEATDELTDTQFGDEQLKLIFTCCHPALEFDKQVALTLNTVAGLTTAEVAQALLLSQKTLEQRLTRTKRKIKQAAIPFVIPEPKHLPGRLNAVLKTLYLMFNSGANQREDTLELQKNACFLVRRLSRLIPQQAETEGMLALMLFHQARQPARFDASGEIIPLSEQNRALWHPDYITEAHEILKTAMQRQALGVYQIQAAIQGVHCHTKQWSDTDWAEIEALYRVHLNLDTSPVVELNAIYAMSMSRGPECAIAQLNQLEASAALAQYAPFYAVKADISLRLKNIPAAIENFTLAEMFSSSSHEKNHFARQAETLRQA